MVPGPARRRPTTRTGLLSPSIQWVARWASSPCAPSVKCALRKDILVVNLFHSVESADKISPPPLLRPTMWLQGPFNRKWYT
ncbi:unnamed protein product [Agarophyton chilense]